MVRYNCEGDFYHDFMIIEAFIMNPKTSTITIAIILSASFPFFNGVDLNLFVPLPLLPLAVVFILEFPLWGESGIWGVTR